MQLFILILGSVWASQAYHTCSSININNIIVCATLNNVYRTFSNLREIYNEFKATGQLWIPVAINACPVSYVDCPSFTPVCVVSGDNICKTFPNKCAVEADQKSTGIVWKTLFNGACPGISGDIFVSVKPVCSSNAADNNQVSWATHHSTPDDADIYSPIDYNGSVEPFTSEEPNRNCLQKSASSIKSHLHTNIHPFVLENQVEQTIKGSSFT